MRAGRAHPRRASAIRGSTASSGRASSTRAAWCNVLEALWANGTALLGDDGRGLAGSRAGRGRRSRSCAALIDARREPGVGDRRRRGADAAGRSATAGPSSCARWPYALDLFEQPDSPVRGRVGIAPCRGHARGRGRRRVDRRLAPGGEPRARATPRLAVELVALPRERAGPARDDRRRGVALYPTRTALYRDPGRDRARIPTLPALLHDLGLTGRPRPVTPYYLMISTTLQPEFSAALVGVKTPRVAIEHARLRLRAPAGGVAVTARQRADRRPGCAFVAPALLVLGRARRLSGPLGDLALAAAADPDLRHRALRRPRALRLPGRRPAHSGTRPGSRSCSPWRRSRSSWSWASAAALALQRPAARTAAGGGAAAAGVGAAVGGDRQAVRVALSSRGRPGELRCSAGATLNWLGDPAWRCRR